MKKLFIGLFLLLIPLFFVIPTFAQSNLASGDNVVLPQNKTINSNYFASGDRVTVSGTVNGDAYVAGGTILIDGTINGDLLVAGGNITIRGKVAHDIRAAGGNITISSPVGGNVTTAGGDINITDAARLNGSLVMVGGNAEVFTPVPKGITLGVGNATVGSMVGGDINAGVGQLTLTPQATVSGNVTYWSDRKLDLAQGASVSGKITQNTPSRESSYAAENAIKGIVTGLSIVFKILGSVYLLVLGLLFVFFLPVYSRVTGETILTQPAKSLLIGFITLLVTPFIIFLLFLGIVTIPLALLLLVLYIILLSVVKIFAAIAIGQQLAKSFNFKLHLAWLFIIGLIVYEIVTMIPVIGWLLGLIALVLALGADLIQKKSYYNLLRTKTKI